MWPHSRRQILWRKRSRSSESTWREGRSGLTANLRLSLRPGCAQKHGISGTSRVLTSSRARPKIRG